MPGWEIDAARRAADHSRRADRRAAVSAAVRGRRAGQLRAANPRRRTPTAWRSTTAQPSSRAAGEKSDCVITADPVAFLLLGYGRISQWSPIMRGKLRAGGRKPWLAMKFGTLMSSP